MNMMNPLIKMEPGPKGSVDPWRVYWRKRIQDLGVCAKEIGYREQTTEPLPQAAGGENLGGGNDTHHFRKLGERCAEHAFAAPEGRTATLWCTVALPQWIRPMQMWQAHGPRVRWVPPAEPDTQEGKDVSSRLEVTGMGAACLVRAKGPNRWALVREQGAGILDGIVALEHGSFERDNGFPMPAFDPGSPRLFGGFSFRTGDQEDSEWSDFGEATFILPEVSFVRDPRAGITVAAVAMSCQPKGLAGRLAGVEALFEGLAETTGRSHDQGKTKASYRSPIGRSSVSDRRCYAERVERAVKAIHHGSLQKVVIARSSLLKVRRSSETELLVQVEKLNPGATTFAFGIGPALFFGATPESLIAVHGKAIRTEALAGTMPADLRPRCRSTNAHGGSSLPLGTSRKDAEEHGFVVDDVLQRLKPLCSVLGTLERRQREAGPVVHLNTQIRGRLRCSRHVVDVAAKLHPTPAVGGVPREAALAWIKDNEELVRGWYAAPLGWFDGSGSGEFRVALRSGLLLPGPTVGPSTCGTRPNDDRPARRALLFAGAGIVEASRPEIESEETELKFEALRPALRSLGGV